MIAVDEPQKIAEAPLGITTNVTVTPGTPAPVLSTTFADRGYWKKVLTLVIWPEPPTAMRAAGAPAGIVWDPHDGAEAPSPEYDPRTTFFVGIGPVQVAVPFEMSAAHRALRPAEKTRLPQPAKGNVMPEPAAPSRTLPRPSRNGTAPPMPAEATKTPAPVQPPAAAGRFRAAMARLRQMMRRTFPRV